jgi:hypothetical protein
MTDDGSALESPRRVFRRRPPPRSGGIFSEGGYDSTMTTDNESSTTEGDSEYDEYDYDSDEEARPRQSTSLICPFAWTLFADAVVRAPQLLSR